MVKGQYDIYRGIFEGLSRTIRKEKLGRKASDIQCLQYALHNLDVRFSNFEFSILGEEQYWLEHSRVVIFPESISVLDKISKAKMSVDYMEFIQFPHESFYLAFPRSYEIAGCPAEGCMVNFYALSERNDFYRHFFKKVGVKVIEEGSQTDDRLAITYFSRYDRSHSRFTLDIKGLSHCLIAKNHIEYNDFMQEMPVLEVGAPMKQTDKDMEYQFELLKLIAKIAIYSSAYSEGLTPGYPTLRPKKLEPKGVKYNDFTLKAKHTTKKVERTWHIRQLMHERYYRNEHAAEARGSRLVFVSATDYDLKIEAETLK